MHEFALAQDIIETIRRQLPDKLGKITSIHLEIGAFSGVVAESLEFGIDVIFSEKKIAGVKVNIVKVPTIARCKCGHEYELDEIFTKCPVCGSFERKVISGMDIVIKSVEISEE
ncbi:MAG: hydrogenase maturation nickel metallochaperone HypA [Candidatus Aminicenantes bacterium]|nr:hydrogenase maturation nickel metallochaperone HypA [Candidatus Aminicenantes bacterium]